MSLRCLLYCYLTSLLLAAQVLAQESPDTTWYIVRHADRAGEDDALTEAGLRRAGHLRDLMKHLRVIAIYSTDTVRTRRTAEPTATALKLPVMIYGSLSEAWFHRIKADHQGQVVLIVAHSNTAGTIVRGLGGSGDFSIADEDHDNLFVVTENAEGIRAVRLRYGDTASASGDER